ncbi:unnamed protein product [Chrysoparadoxa australica]
MGGGLQQPMSLLVLATCLGVVLGVAIARRQEAGASARLKRSKSQREKTGTFPVQNEASSNITRPTPLSSRASPGKRVEILVHNVSHKDMVVRLAPGKLVQRRLNQGKGNGPPGQVPGELATALARPKFSLFHPVSEMILTRLMHIRAEGRQLNLAAVPSYTAARAVPRSTAVGFHVAGSDAVPVADLSSYRIRSRDATSFGGSSSGASSNEANSISSSNSGRRMHNRRSSQGVLLVKPSDSQNSLLQHTAEARLVGVYFPLLAVLLPKWKQQILESGDDDCDKVLYLSSGVGVHRNEITDDEEGICMGNSTEITAQLMKIFIEATNPDVQVRLIHSTTNIFRYDENIRFVQKELLPIIESERNKMAATYGGDWSDMFHITLSFADGAPARILSMNASLRYYKPSYMHIWELKSFWKDGSLSEDDVEVHTFEDMETVPPVLASEIAQADHNCSLVINEMRQLRDDFLNIAMGQPNDLASFWLRKTKKPVLAVLLVQHAGGVKLYRGTNMEVSMPTGSLCAERNVIGTALAQDLALRRQDLKMVAVLAMTVPGSGASPQAASPMSPLGNPKRVPYVAPLQLDGLSEDLEYSESDGSPIAPKGRGLREGAERERTPRRRSQSCGSSSEAGRGKASGKAGTVGPPPGRPPPATPPRKRGNRDKLVRSLGIGWDVRRSAGSGVGRVVQKVVPGEGGLNPLRPCGACNEWLRKIAEVNPSFKVITFTDVNLDGVYVESIH